MIARRAQALCLYSNRFCPQCRGELRSPKRYIIKAQVPNWPYQQAAIAIWQQADDQTRYLSGRDLDTISTIRGDDFGVRSPKTIQFRSF
uniref:Uncharacterized protein n=1 Tax=Microcystis aeruginosa (strain PCC 7806) TaxID=267872 RepID=A8YNC7_MICA7|nr:unnamed protein product [Microcystis aeruginosa PCC 7806]